MRLAAIAIVALACAALVGCGDSERPTWDGPPTPLPADGRLPVDRFATYLDAVDEHWEHSTVGLATAYVLPLAVETTDLHTEFQTSDPDGNAIVTVTLSTLDDSVRELRFVLRFDPVTDTSFRPLDAIWQQRCQLGRGHQSWSHEPCV
jgi:hypothetical protein